MPRDPHRATGLAALVTDAVHRQWRTWLHLFVALERHEGIHFERGRSLVAEMLG